tara:strand:+ start:941 stop:1516 length:576 start_codon:yes stop_codon:yes gene_type:complete
MLRYIIIILIFTKSSSAKEKIITQVEDYVKITFDEVLFISTKNQKLYHIKNKEIIDEYTISTSKYGVGNKNGSNKTPLGLHMIKEKHGDNVPINGKLIGRIFYDQIAFIYKDNTISKTDDITSRILWLDGMEKGKNQGGIIDSYNRYIYIHGTSEEGRLGKPASHGCIRMGNKDVIDLYKRVKVGTLVLIL